MDRNSFVNRFTWLENQFEAMKGTVEQISTKQQALEIKMKEMGSKVYDKFVEATAGVGRQISKIRAEMHEHQRKIAHMSNIVLFGVPEGKEGLD
jgi:cytidylate kinase